MAWKCEVEKKPSSMTATDALKILGLGAQNLEAAGKFLTILTHFGPFRPYLSLFDLFWPKLDHFRLFLVQFDPFGPLLDHFDIFGPF